jgi:drug/metabolite transporter (DMT)-like permease
LYLGALTSVGAYLLWVFALKRLDAARVAVFINLQPVITALLDWLIRGQVITAMEIGGGLLVIVGVRIVQRSRRSALATPALPVGSPAIVGENVPGTSPAEPR